MLHPMIGPAGALALIVLPAMALAGETPPTEDCTLMQLSETYLECERRARTDLMAHAEVARCSAIYEDLKARRFDGSAQALRDWFRQTRGLRTEAGIIALVPPGRPASCA